MICVYILRCVHICYILPMCNKSTSILQKLLYIQSIHYFKRNKKIEWIRSVDYNDKSKRAHDYSSFVLAAESKSKTLASRALCIAFVFRLVARGALNYPSAIRGAESCSRESIDISTLSSCVPLPAITPIFKRPFGIYAARPVLKLSRGESERLLLDVLDRALDARIIVERDSDLVVVVWK